MSAPWSGRAPRAWQQEAYATAITAIAPERAPLIEAVMGAGKSVLLAEIAAWAVSQGWRVVVSTPTQALVRQLAKTVRERVPSTGEFYASTKDTGQAVTVTCYPSVAAMMAADPRPVGLWLCDEAHRSESARELAAAEAMAPARRLALTATPYLAEGGTLSLWTELAYRYPLGAALRDGVLVPWRVVEHDGHPEDVDAVVARMVRDTDGPGVIDARSIEDAEGFAVYLAEQGISARPIHSMMSPRAQAAALEDLRTGRVRCLVHVSMLVEGVDLPWLRWLGMRRRVGSRVRFLQQLGRVLRTHPGKTEAVVLDPWGLMVAHDLEYAAALGGAYDNPADDAATEVAPKDEEAWDLIDLPPLQTAPLMVPRATAKRAAAAWVRRVLHAATDAGIRQPSEWEADATWRNRPASSKAIAAVGRMAWATRFVRDERAKVGIKALLTLTNILTGGIVSDLLDILKASADFGTSAGHGWSPKHLTIPSLPARVSRGLTPEVTP